MQDIPALPRITTPAIRDSAYEILRDKIMRKDFGPGQRLDLEIIERQLGISRTPLREALHRLASERLVEIVPRSGTFVTVLSPDDIAESYEVRRAIELYAVERAAQQATDRQLAECRALLRDLACLGAADDVVATYPQYLSADYELHRRIVSLAGNQRLSRAYERENVHAQLARVHYRRIMRDLDVTQREHDDIVAALELHDAASARVAMDAHLLRAKAAILTDMGVDIHDTGAARTRAITPPAATSRE
jgi:GntR family transcriptional regulator, rspAB operon transcriptional repressor